MINNEINATEITPITKYLNRLPKTNIISCIKSHKIKTTNKVLRNQKFEIPTELLKVEKKLGTNTVHIIEGSNKANALLAKVTPPQAGFSESRQY